MSHGNQPMFIALLRILDHVLATVSLSSYTLALWTHWIKASKLSGVRSHSKSTFGRMQETFSISKVLVLKHSLLRWS